MGFIYDTPEQARLRLSGTLVIYNGGEEPRLVWCGDDPVVTPAGIVLTVQDTVNGKTHHGVNLRELDYNTQLQGYFTRFANNKPPSTYYISRVPSRQQRQGMHRENTMVSEYNDVENRSPNYSLNGGFITADMLNQLVYKKYLSVEQIRRRIEKIANDDVPVRIVTVALSPDFCVEIDRVMNTGRLFHIGKAVGFATNVMEGELEFTIPKRFMYLAETIQEQGIKWRS